MYKKRFIVSVLIWFSTFRSASRPLSNVKESTGNSKGVGVLRPQDAKYFDQEQNHFDNGNHNRWKQRFWIIENNCGKIEDVIFVCFKDHETADPHQCLNMVEQAKAFCAIFIIIELRGVGKSHATKDWSTEFLNIPQILTDVAHLISYVINQFNVTNAETKVVIVGFNLGGTLAAWFRYKYEHLSLGAIVFDAPIKLQLEDLGYIPEVERKLAKENPDCLLNIADAFVDIVKLLKDRKKRKEIAKLFNWCHEEEIGNWYEYYDDKDIQAFLLALFNSVADVVENNNNDSPYTELTTTNLCRIMTEKTTATNVERFANFHEWFAKINWHPWDYKYYCQEDATYFGSIQRFIHRNYSGYEKDAQKRNALFLHCYELGGHIVSNSSSKIFGHAFNLTLAFYADRCQNLFGQQASFENGFKDTQLQYGGPNPRFTNVLSFYGTDKLRQQAIVKESSGSFKVIQIQGASSCTNVFGLDDNTDTESVKAARKEMSSWLQALLKQSTVQETTPHDRQISKSSLTNKTDTIETPSVSNYHQIKIALIVVSCLFVLLASTPVIHFCWRNRRYFGRAVVGDRV